MKIFKVFLTILVTAVFCLSYFSPVSAENEDKDKKYLIGEGDVLNINVWKEPDLTQESIRVRIDGKITFPLLDDIQASGLTTMELKDVITKKLGDFVEAPTVTVTLLDAASKKFYILGEIQKTGEYPILKNLTVMQAFALAGGFTEWASKKEILLFRYENGKQKKIVINYKDIVKGDFSKNIPVRADDIIVVP
ncbi:MAG: polysaccharide biosynthesis/export family protein [Thermodesulfobacteriota bacterium]